MRRQDKISPGQAGSGPGRSPGHALPGPDPGPGRYAGGADHHAVQDGKDQSTDRPGQHDVRKEMASEGQAVKRKQQGIENDRRGQNRAQAGRDQDGDTDKAAKRSIAEIEDMLANLAEAAE